MTDANAGILTDLYQLTMCQAYLVEGMTERAVFELLFRRLPQERSFLLTAGLEDALAYLERLTFTADALAYLASLERFSPAFLDWLASFAFTGDVRAVPEGTPVFAGEPVLEVAGPLPEAQLVETFLLNQVHLQTLVASKAARVVAAAQGRAVVDFGLRRAHGTDAGLKAARASYLAGAAGTSNVLAGQVYGIPVSGTMAHSYVEAHASELEAFRSFTVLYPDAVLLVDTYDTLGGVRAVVRLAKELGSDFRVRAVRLDSGDLASLAHEARRILDGAGLERVEIFASGGLDEHRIADLLEGGAPIAGFGVGTRMDVSADAPHLDCAYKLVAYAGKDRMKLGGAKSTLPGSKQVFRMREEGIAARDVVALADEDLPGEPLLEPVMRGGARLPAGHVPLEKARRRAGAALAALPARCLALTPARPPYPVETSPALIALRDRVRREVAAPVS